MVLDCLLRNGPAFFIVAVFASAAHLSAVNVGVTSRAGGTGIAEH